MLKNGRPFIIPASIVRVTPSNAAASAASRLARHTKRGREPVAGPRGNKTDAWFRDPSSAGARFVQRPVAAPHDDERRAGCRARRRELARVPGAFGDVNVGVQPAAFRLGAYERDAARGRGRVRAGAGDRIDDRDDRHVLHFEAVERGEPCYSNVQHRRLEDA